MGDPCLSVWLQRAHRCLPHALGKAKMGADTARPTCLIVSLDLGASGEMRKPLLASAEQNRLVWEAPIKLEQQLQFYASAKSTRGLLYAALCGFSNFRFVMVAPPSQF